MTLNGSLVKSSRGCPLLGVPDRFWIYKNLKAVLDYHPIFCSKSTCELRERESIKGRAGNGVSKGELLMYASAACQTLSSSCLCLVPKDKTPRYFESAISVRKWVDQLRSAKKSGEFSYQSNGGFLPM